MELIFEETKNRNQCVAEVMVSGVKMQCTFSTAKVVTIPKGLSYFNDNLKQSENSPAITVSICQNHEIRLKNAFARLFQNEAM